LAYVDLWLVWPRVWAMSGLQVMPISERLALAMFGLQVMSTSGLRASANVGSQMRPCSKTPTTLAHTLSRPKAQPWQRSQSLSHIFSLWIAAIFFTSLG
jgi:hypothetical protein